MSPADAPATIAPTVALWRSERVIPALNPTAVAIRRTAESSQTAVLSETSHLLGGRGEPSLAALLERRALIPGFDLGDELEPVLRLLQKYADVPMSLANACLVRMTETLADPIILTTDADFRVYRRHSRQVVPCVLPS